MSTNWLPLWPALIFLGAMLLEAAAGWLDRRLRR